MKSPEDGTSHRALKLMMMMMMMMIYKHVVGVS
jgi:hypothetical protein